jgi:Flp pilus assembly protein TadG
MALVTPLLVTLMFGASELGNYYYDNHVAVKAVRDAARYASRRGFADYTCPSTISSGAITATRNVTLTGQASSGTPRLSYWSNPATVTVSLACADNSSETYSGVYFGRTTVPVVRVSAAFPYRSLFSLIGFNTTGLMVRAESEVPVMGV